MDSSSTDRSSQPRRRPGRLARVTWRAQVVVLAVVGGFVALSGIVGSEDANIGFGLGVLALGAMGVPWTLPLLGDQRVMLDSVLVVVVVAAGALVNLGLHAAVARWWGRLARAR